MLTWFKEAKKKEGDGQPKGVKVNWRAGLLSAAPEGAPAKSKKKNDESAVDAKHAVGDKGQKKAKADPKLKAEADGASTNAAVLRDQKPKESSTIRFRSIFREATGSDKAYGVTKFRCQMIVEGLGNLKDGFYYTKESLENAVGLFEGKKIYADHPSKLEDEVRPERSVRDILGYFENVEAVEAEGGQTVMEGDVCTPPDQAFDWSRALMRQATEYSKKFPSGDFVGLSINASGEAEPVAIQDFIERNDIPDSALEKLKKAQAEGLETVRVVSALTAAVSCDLVTEAGAGGKILQMLEEEKHMSKKQAKSKESKEPKEAEGEEDAAALKKKEDEAAPAKDDGEKAGAADGDGHDDKDQDADLIKKMLKEYLGDDHAEDPEAQKSAKEAYEGFKKLGYKEDEAMKCAGHSMKLAKHLQAKQAEAEAHEDESESEAKESDESKDAKDDDSKKESDSALVKLQGEVTKLREALRKREMKELLDKKLADLKESRRVTDEIRKLVGEPRSEAHVNGTISTFMAGFKSVREASETASGDGIDFAIFTEKNTPVVESKDSVSFDDCVRN